MSAPKDKRKGSGILSWLLPFSALRESYQGLSFSFLTGLLSSFWAIATQAFRSLRWSPQFVWSGNLGIVFSLLAIFFAATGQIIKALIMLVALIASCFLRVRDRDGRS